MEIYLRFWYNLLDKKYGGNHLLRNILFALELGLRVIGSFLICIYIGISLDDYFQSQPICILLGILFAFVYVMKLLLGVKNE